MLEFWAQDRFTHEHIVEMKNDSKTVQLDHIHAGLQVVQKKENEQDFLQYKVALMTLAIDISTSARGLWGFGSQVSKNEKKTLKELSTLLKVPLT